VSGLWESPRLEMREGGIRKEERGARLFILEPRTSILEPDY